MTLPSELPDPNVLALLPVAYDTETSGLHPDDGANVFATSIAYRDSAGVLHTHAFTFDHGRAREKGFEPALTKVTKAKPVPTLVVPGSYEWDEEDLNLPKSEWDAFGDWLIKAGEIRGLVTQNGKFDIGQTLNGTRHWDGFSIVDYVVWDTMLGSRILDPRESAALKATAARIWGSEETAEAKAVDAALITVKQKYGIKDPRYDLVPWSIMGPYAAQDTALTLRLFEHQYERFEMGEGPWEVIHRENALMRTLARMEARGYGPLDVETLDEWVPIMQERMFELEKIFPFVPTGPQAAAYYFDVIGWKNWGPGEERRVIDRTTGKVLKQGTLSVEMAEEMGQEGVPFASAYAEYAHLKTSLQMWHARYPELMGKDRMLRTDFKQGFVKSGRLSVSRFQAQNLPRRANVKVKDKIAPEPRALILTPPGMVRINADLGQAELRIAAKVAGCQTMVDLINNDQDVHGNTAKALFNITEDHPDWKARRQVSKSANFSNIFGIGAQKFQAMLWKQSRTRIEMQESQHIIYGFRRTYPEYQDAYYKWMTYAEVHRRVPLVSGNMSYFGIRDYPNSAWSRVVQSSLAEFVGRWLVMVDDMTKEYNALQLSVHDSVSLVVPADVATQIGEAIEKATVASWINTFGIIGKLDVEYSYAKGEEPSS